MEERKYKKDRDKMIEFQAKKSTLVIPVSREAETVSATLRSGNDFLKLNIPATMPDHADFIAEYPLPFPPEQTTIESEESLFRTISWKDRPDDAADIPAEPLRPRFHFAPVRGWLNDPNGLFYRNGEWHLFFQHNPFSTQWGNMHWKHAVSRDLLHWREQGIALYPDSIGTMYSGSAVIDRENVAGFGKDAILLFYTNASYAGVGSQNIAYSVDGGRTFRKYEKNPILPSFHGCRDRDPSVVYDPEEACWRMALYLGDETKQEFLLLESQNLLDWSVTDLYKIANGRECPVLRRMVDESSGTWKWLFAEANGFYRIGTISHGKIAFESESRRFLCGDAYAGQCFANTPDNDTVYLAWMRMPHPFTKTYNGTMSSPMRLSLRNGLLRSEPYRLCGKCEPFETSALRTLQLPDGMLTFDPANHRVDFQDRSWNIPSEITVLKGRLVLDATSLEYFDDSGLFTFCLSCRTEPELSTIPGGSPENA